jgi:hypothetical protein
MDKCCTLYTLRSFCIIVRNRLVVNLKRLMRVRQESLNRTLDGVNAVTRKIHSVCLRIGHSAVLTSCVSLPQMLALYLRGSTCVPRN